MDELVGKEGSVIFTWPNFLPFGICGNISASFQTKPVDCNWADDLQKERNLTLINVVNKSVFLSHYIR